ILWANAAELELLGFTPGEYIGHHIAAFHDDPAAVEDILARFRRNELIRNYPARLRRKDGTTRDVLVSSVLRRDGEFAQTCCITRDVTEQRRVEDDRHRLLRQLTVEHALTRALASPRELGPVAAEVLRVLGGMGHWDCALFWIPDQTTKTMQYVESWQAA